MSPLFQPFTLRSLALPNRVVVSPMCQYSAVDGCATDWHLAHWTQLLQTGAGLVYLEATAVSPEGRISPQDLGLYDAATEAAFADALHRARRLAPPTRVALQVAHAGRIPILGVCLGHQAIGQAFGGHIVRAARVMHGKLDAVTHDGRGVFAGVPSPVTVTRYHSLAIERDCVPDCLEVTARTPDGEIMGVRHREHAVEGVQFHPEAILTEHGHAMLRNFLDGKR